MAYGSNHSWVQYAPTEEVEAFAADLPEKFLQCREMGHNWRPWTAAWDTGERCYERVLRCTRCHTKREQLISSVGAMVRSQYIYPEGYENRGFGRITGEGRDRLRLESVTRAVKKAS